MSPAIARDEAKTVGGAANRMGAYSRFGPRSQGATTRSQLRVFVCLGREESAGTRGSKSSTSGCLLWSQHYDATTPRFRSLDRDYRGILTTLGVGDEVQQSLRDKGSIPSSRYEGCNENKSFRRKHHEMEQESNVESASRAKTRRIHGLWPGVAPGGIVR